MDEHALCHATDPGLSPLGQLAPEVAYFIRESRAPATRRLYQWAWNRVLGWCKELDRCPLPMSETTAALIFTRAANSNMKTGTIRDIRAAVSIAHKLAGEPDPMAYESVRSVMRGIRRVLGENPNQKVAFGIKHLRLIREKAFTHPHAAHAHRDWSVVSAGTASAMRRSELATRDVEDLEFRKDGVVIRIDRSKTDQYGRSSRILVQYGNDPLLCPVRALQAWLTFVEGPGPLFRPVDKYGNVIPRRLAAHSIGHIVKRYAAALNLPELAVGSHSMRAGFVTAALDAGLPSEAVMAHSRHACKESLLRYYRPTEPHFNMTRALGL